MKKFNIVMSVLLLVGLVMALPAFSAANEHSKSRMHKSKSMSGSQAFNASDLIGKEVQNQKGEKLGKVEDVVLGRKGNAEFVVLSRNGATGAGSEYIAVPIKTFMSSWTNMARINKDSDVIAKLDKAKLDSAPSFTNKKDLAGRNMQNKVCRYYGFRACPHYKM
jgi:sporulation protein YlmC with PRC-barrel domain